MKVFKTTLTDFKTRERYIREDYRFKDRMTKNNTQKVGLVVDANIFLHSHSRIHVEQINKTKAKQRITT